MPTSSGIEARKMPTAPRRPTQEMNSFSREENANGARHRNTAAGRARNIRPAATISAGPALEGSRAGVTNRPSSTNITIWASQVTASRNTTNVPWARVRRLPTIRPAR